MTYAQLCRFLLLRALEYCDQYPDEPEVQNFLRAFAQLKTALDELDIDERTEIERMLR